MADIQKPQDTGLAYVASKEAPPPRRPPSSEVGLYRWVRENLFRTWWDAIITVLMLGLILAVLNQLFGWAIFEAQWEVNFLNLRVIGVGSQFPAAQVWRAELAVFILFFLTMMSVGIWGRMRRTITYIVLGILAALYIIPVASQVVPLPTVHFFLGAGFTPRQANFLAQAGQEATFTIEPLTNLEDFRVASINGYIENDNQVANTSFEAFTSAITQITFTQDRDPDEYNLNLAIQIWDANGRVIAESDYTEGSRETLSFNWEAPYSGWYTLTVAQTEDSSAGAAWLKTNDIEIFRSTRPATAARTAQYGEQPVLDCPCATEFNRTDMRYEGRRTLPQWFSLQLTPFFEEIRQFVVTAFLTGVLGYFVGRGALRSGIGSEAFLKPIENLVLSIAAVWFFGYIGVQIVSIFTPQPLWAEIRLMILWAFIFTIFVYALVQFLKRSPQAASRGITLLWLLSIPLIITILNGFPAVPDAVSAPPLPEIPSTRWGGMLLTILLSAIAIIASFPIGMALALGRQSNLPIISLFSTIFIEVVRGVPLITLLFMGRLILPFFGFGLADVDLLIRISVVLTLFTSAYMAEVIRGGLQIIPKGQLEASYALGLNNFWTTTLVVLPQALRAVIPAMMGQAVSLFKDTSLVFIVGLLEVLGTMNQILGDSQTGYLSFPREGYLYIGILYFVVSYIMADMSRRIERSGSGAVRRETM